MEVGNRLAGCCGWHPRPQRRTDALDLGSPGRHYEIRAHQAGSL